MKAVVIAVAMLVTVAPAIAQGAPKQEQVMKIRHSGSQPSQKGPAEWLTGNVRIAGWMEHVTDEQYRAGPPTN